MLKSWSELSKIDVTPFCEYREAKDEKGKKIQVAYLNWAKCVDLLHENGAETVYYEPLYNKNGHSLFMSDIEFKDKNEAINRCYEVRVKVVVDDQQWEMNYPLLNGTYIVRNDTINQLRVSNAQARAFVKCIAIHTGLGFQLWLKESEIEKSDMDDLSFHNIFSVKKRIEEEFTAKLQRGMEFKDILSALNLSQRQWNTLMGYFNIINNFEQALKKL